MDAFLLLNGGISKFEKLSRDLNLSMIEFPLYRRVLISDALMKSSKIKQFSNNIRQFPPQTDLRQTFGDGDKFYFLERGRLRILELCGDGNEILLEELGAGDFFSESSFFLKM